MSLTAEALDNLVGRLRGASLAAAGAAWQLSASGWPLSVARKVSSPDWFVVKTGGVARPQPHGATALTTVAVRPPQSWRPTRSGWFTSSQPTRNALAMPWFGEASATNSETVIAPLRRLPIKFLR